MNEYGISNYGIFSNAVTTTQNYNEKINNIQETIREVEQTLSDQGVFMGPVQENCAQTISTLNVDVTGITENFATIQNYLVETSSTYQSGDAQASNLVLNGSSANSATALATGSMTGYTYNGKNFNVVNTKTSISDYEQYIQKNGLYQSAGVLGGQCMLLSQYYATDLLKGSGTSKSTMVSHGGSPATKINERVTSATPDAVLQYTYDELSSGNPVVLQVTQKKSNQGLRHLVTAVGYDSSVTNYSELTPDKILVLDCYDGKIQTLNERNRQLYNQGGTYQALGATEKFLQTTNA